MRASNLFLLLRKRARCSTVEQPAMIRSDIFFVAWRVTPPLGRRDILFVRQAAEISSSSDGELLLILERRAAAVRVLFAPFSSTMEGEAGLHCAKMAVRPSPCHAPPLTLLPAGIWYSMGETLPATMVHH